MKFCAARDKYLLYQSPPARGAWIEMLLNRVQGRIYSVAPRTGGVD